MDVIEAGFAIASEGDASAIEAISKEIRVRRFAPWRGLTRKMWKRRRARWKAQTARAFTSSWPVQTLHLECKLKITRAEALERAGST